MTIDTTILRFFVTLGARLTVAILAMSHLAVASADDAFAARAVQEERDQARARTALILAGLESTPGHGHSRDAVEFALGSIAAESETRPAAVLAFLDQLEALQEQYESGEIELAPRWSSLNSLIDTRNLELAYRLRAFRFMSQDVSVNTEERERYERDTFDMASQRLEAHELTDSDVDELMKSRKGLLESGSFHLDWQKFFMRLSWAYSTETQRYLQVVEGPYVAPTRDQIRDLYHESVDAGLYKGGRYANAPKLFMFCRHQRQYPCLMVMKDDLGQPVEVQGKLWNQPALGLSKYGKRFDENSGYTPSGVYQMDGVMPRTNDPLAYGKFRRIILNFLERSPNEISFQYLLPKSHWGANWWKESIIARNLGRNSLRIHGTGHLNPDPQSTYYPLYPTSGCIAQRENSYREATYRDQRHLLDRLMISFGLAPVFRNEVQIRGLLYVLEINDVPAAVTLRDLTELGIR